MTVHPRRYEVIVERDPAKVTTAVLELMDRVDDLDGLLADSNAILQQVNTAASQATASASQASDSAAQAQAAAQAISGGHRSAFVALNATGIFGALPDGSTLMIDGLAYVRQAGATAIPDLPGWVPGGQVSFGHWGPDATGGTDSTIQYNAASGYAYAEDVGILVRKGTYVHTTSGGVTTSYTISGDAIVSNRDFSGGANFLQLARTAGYTIVSSTPDNSEAGGERYGYAATLYTRGGQHGNAARLNLYNYSGFSGGNTALYTHAESMNEASWTAALHGETIHRKGTTIAGNFEAASYAADGTFLGCVINNTSNNADRTGQSVENTSSQALRIGGTYTTAPKGSWRTGIHFTAGSLHATSGVGINMTSPAAYQMRVSAPSTEADIYLNADSANGFVASGNYSGSAFRMSAGKKFSYDGIGTYHLVWNAEDYTLRLMQGENNCISFRTASNPAINISGTQVVGTRKTGWAADTGTADRTAHSTYAAPVAAVAYNAGQVQGLMEALQSATRQIKALKDDLIAHGLIGS